uniref:Zeta toxin domain-containing protein n=1 Tax=Compsopogon caeruleus TaxID=31354 RepID=A0A7S1TBM1_9RHOD|mmetsp:Transcript_16574/g.33940  ORF Transcript_16574/g.33940 Transcript_16574/m.33940 type:complete len:402 (+) Transcript_16574:690-1895(+)
MENAAGVYSLCRLVRALVLDENVTDVRYCSVDEVVPIDRNARAVWIQPCTMENVLSLLGCKKMLIRKVLDAIFLGSSAHVVVAGRGWIENLVLGRLQRSGVVYPGISGDLAAAIDTHLGHNPLVVLLGGTSGCGKSTLASLLARRLGISSVVSTDSVRNAMRAFLDPDTADGRVLQMSTYNAVDGLDRDEEISVDRKSSSAEVLPSMTSTRAVTEAYLRQCDLVAPHIVRVVTSHVQRQQSVIIEGVHLSIRTMLLLMQSYPEACLPFLIHIRSAEKHRHRFAVRAKYMDIQRSRRSRLGFDQTGVLNCAVRLVEPPWDVKEPLSGVRKYSSSTKSHTTRAVRFSSHANRESPELDDSAGSRSRPSRGNTSSGSEEDPLSCPSLGSEEQSEDGMRWPMPLP